MSKVLQNAPREHSAILSTFIKLPFVFNTFVLSIFEWPLKTGFTVLKYICPLLYFDDNWPVIGPNKHLLSYSVCRNSVCSQASFVFVPVWLIVLCGHLLGKGWPLGSPLWCLTVSLSLSHWYPRSGMVLDCIYSWSLHPYLLSSEPLLLLYVVLFSCLFVGAPLQATRQEGQFQDMPGSPTLVTVYVDLPVFMHIAGTSWTGSGQYWCKYYIEKHVICHKDYRLQSCLRIQYVHGDLCKHLAIDSSTDRMIGNRSVLEYIPKCLYTQKKKFSQYLCFLIKSTILHISLSIFFTWVVLS